jgi:serine protease AprX
MRNPLTKAVWGAVLALALMWPSTGMAAPPHSSGKLDGALQNLSAKPGESVDVIVRAKPGHKASVTDKVSRRTARYKVHELIDAVSARLTSQQIKELLDDPDVDGVSIDADVSASGSTSSSSDVISDVKQSLDLGNWFTGSSVTVAIIDSGIATGVDFDSRIVAQYVFASGKAGVLSTPYDDYGHGTHVAGLVGSSGASSNNRYAGIAPGVKLVSLKVLDKKGTGKTSDVINALAFAVANQSRYGIKVINLSLGHPIYESAKTDPLVLAVEQAVRAGIVVVVAAGNYGTSPVTGQSGFGGIASPGNSPSAITVGAAVTNNTAGRADDRLASYSSRGPAWYDGIAKPDILAPGQGLVSNDSSGSTLETTYPSLIVRSGASKYLRLSGSSMSTGVVSGLAAIMIEANQFAAEQRWQQSQDLLKRNQRSAFPGVPMLSSSTIKAMLQYSATRIHNDAGVIYSPLEQGAGLVNGLGAIALAYAVDTTKAVGQYWATFEMPPTTNFGGVEEPWSETVIWGTRLLHGTSVVYLRQSAWEANIAWGTGELTDKVWAMMSDGEDNIVWGTVADEDNIVWGTSVPLSTDLTWAGNALLEDNIVWGTAANWEDNIVWGTGLVGVFDGQSVIWGTCSGDEDNIVWGTLSEDNIVWGTSANKVSVLGTSIGGAL